MMEKVTEDASNGVLHEILYVDDLIIIANLWKIFWKSSVYEKPRSRLSQTLKNAPFVAKQQQAFNEQRG